MTDYEVRVGGDPVAPEDGWRLIWLDRSTGAALMTDGERGVPVVIEGGGTEWFVSVGGRRIPVTVRSWRERLLAEVETDARVHAGPVEVKATLPGLVVAIRAAAGDEVEEGASLLTIEAMKMQNEVRAPRAGRVLEVAVTSGQAVATGAVLLRLE